MTKKHPKIAFKSLSTKIFTVKKIDVNASNETTKTFFASDKKRFCLWEWCSSIPIVCKLVLSTPNIFILICMNFWMYSSNLKQWLRWMCPGSWLLYNLKYLVWVVWSTSNNYANAFLSSIKDKFQFRRMISSDFKKVNKSNYSTKFRSLLIIKKKNELYFLLFWICEQIPSNQIEKRFYLYVKMTLVHKTNIKSKQYLRLPNRFWYLIIVK